jgi:hypothetical protein
VKRREITSAEELAGVVSEMGMLPIFKTPVEGFSVQEMTPGKYWFTELPGPWEWRMELAESGRFVYAKLFDGRAGLMLPELYTHLANWRRRGYDFDSLYEEGLAPLRLKGVMDALGRTEGGMLSHDLKAACGLEKSFDAAVSKLQMMTYISVKRFEYRTDKYGRRFGWGVARYDVSERIYGEKTLTGAYGIEPEESFGLLLEKMKKLCPDAEEKKLIRLLR